VLTRVRAILVYGAAIFSAACCEENALQTARSVDGAIARVVSRECGATVGYVTKVMLGPREILRMNADARTVSLEWASDGKSLFVSIPEDVARRDIFVKENTADGRSIVYRRQPSDHEGASTQR